MANKTKILAVLAFVSFLAVTFLFTNTCFAEKISYVDLAVVFDGYEKTKDYDVKLEGIRKTEQDKIDKKVEQIKALQDKMSLLSDAEKNKKQEEIDKLARELQEYQRSAETTLVKDRNEKLQEVLKDIQAVVEEMAKKDGYDLVINERTLLYANDKLNITDTVLKKLNDKYKKG
ncbi:MAG: OmpH family outer membrane protein [Candidatus Omnitrophica bacterium]|nr:OmpH family outer membrane protein [Candidatus Omnitrophota bacterium]